MKPNLKGFLEELDTLSRKHGVWIDVSDTGYVDLIDQDHNVLADGLYNDESSQEYSVNEDYTK